MFSCSLLPAPSFCCWVCLLRVYPQFPWYQTFTTSMRVPDTEHSLTQCTENSAQGSWRLSRWWKSLQGSNILVAKEIQFGFYLENNNNLKKSPRFHSQVAQHKRFTLDLNIYRKQNKTTKQWCINPVNKYIIVSQDPLASTMDALYLLGYRKGGEQNYLSFKPFERRERRDSRHTITKCLNWKLLQKMHYSAAFRWIIT